MMEQDETQGSTKVPNIMNVRSMLNGNPSNSCGDFSLGTTNANLMMSLEEESGHHVSRTHPISIVKNNMLFCFRVHHNWLVALMQRSIKKENRTWFYFLATSSNTTSQSS